MKTRLGLLALLILTNCTSKTEIPLYTGPAHQPNLGIDIEKINEISFFKAGPESIDHWHARLVKTQTGEWEISSHSEHDLIDRHANSRLIHHLLDTLRTLHVKSPERTQDYGLKSPRFVFTWKSDGENILRFGNAAPSGEGRYVQLSQGQIGVASGALLQMFGYISRFEKLRENTLSGIDADDVDELELKVQGHLSLYAQREGDSWATSNRKPIKRNIEETVRGLAHAQIKEYIDDPTQAKILAQQIKTHPDFEACLKDRQGHPIILSFKKMSGNLMATASNRENAVFQTFPELARYWMR